MLSTSYKIVEKSLLGNFVKKRPKLVVAAAMTAGDLGERLQASSGAVSGAVKMLTSVGLVERVPAPASRRDHYRLRDNAWAIQYTSQNEVTSAVLKAAEAGIIATEDGSLARQRLTQMRDFYNFLFEEISALLDRWYQRSGSAEM
jgi:DNA-binding transcriptional regulator GbsR (MarR family)